MPQGTQDTYVQLPNGSYVQIPRDATPEQLSAFKTRLRSFASASGMTEAQAREKAGAPDPNVQAAERLQRPILEHKEPIETMTVPIGTGAMGAEARGTPAQLAPTRQSMKDLGVTTGAVLGGEVAAPIAEIYEGVRAVPSLIRAVGAGTGGGAAAKASGESTKEAAITGGEVALTDLGAQAVLRGLTAAYDHIFADPKLTMQQASKLLADAISKEDLSPREFGKGLQDAFDHVRTSAGQAKGELITRISREHPDLSVGSRNVQDVLRQEVNNLQFLKSRNPELFREGEAMDRTLKILDRELKGVQNLDLTTADTRRSQFWNYKQQLDPSMASRIVGQLDRAATQDIATALAGKDPKLAQEYLAASNRYKELSDIGRTNTLKAVFGNKRVAPGQVVEVLNQAPEDSMVALRDLKLQNPAAIQNLRRALFEQSIKTAGARGLFKLQPSLVREIYGPQADAVSQFINVVNRKAAGGNLFSKLPGKAGAMFRIMEAGGRPGITIRASEMAKILKSAEMIRVFTQAAQMPANAGPATMMRDTLDRAILAAQVQPEVTPRASRRPVWAEERRTGVQRRQAEGTSPTGTERRGVATRSFADITGPSQERSNLIRNLQRKINELPEGNDERKVLEDQLKDIQANPFERHEGGDIQSMKRERRMSRSEAEAETERRKEGRSRRFEEEE